MTFPRWDAEPDNGICPMTESQKQFIMENAIARLAAGDSREQIRAAMTSILAPDLEISEDDWKELLNKAVLEEANRHNAALPDFPDPDGYSPAPIDFHPEDKITISCRGGTWSAGPADAEFLDRERCILPKPGSKAIHSKDGIITSELLPDTWEGVKQWQERRKKTGPKSFF